MKYLLLVLFFIFSTQSFADLKDKGLICKLPNAAYSSLRWHAFVFDKSKVERFMIARKDGKFKLKSLGSIDYYTDNEFIYMKTFTIKVNRKNLGYYYFNPKNSKYDKKIGDCIVHKSEKKLMKQMKIHVKEEQRIYNKSLEENKI